MFSVTVHCDVIISTTCKLRGAFTINVASPGTLSGNGFVLNETVGNVIELVDHIHHTSTQNDAFKICNIKKSRFS